MEDVLSTSKFWTGKQVEMSIQSIPVRKRPDQLGHSLTDRIFDRVDNWLEPTNGVSF